VRDLAAGDSEDLTVSIGVGLRGVDGASLSESVVAVFADVG
jgi:hypothetical protein